MRHRRRCTGWHGAFAARSPPPGAARSLFETMNRHTLQYLQALEIDVWQRRGVAAPPPEVESRPVAAPPAPTIASNARPSPAPEPCLEAGVATLGWAELEQRV